MVVSYKTIIFEVTQNKNMIYNRFYIKEILIPEYEEMGIPRELFLKEFNKMSDDEISQMTGIKLLRKGFFVL